jgi:hypothetical protein
MTSQMTSQMTSWAVLDSSILLATVLPERFSQKAIALIASLTGQQIPLLSCRECPAFSACCRSCRGPEARPMLAVIGHALRRPNFPGLDPKMTKEGNTHSGPDAVSL